MRHLTLFATFLALTLLTACTGVLPMHESAAEVRDRYNAYAGPPVDHFTWMGRYDSWEPIGRDQLVVFTGVSDAYLLRLSPPCNDLQFRNSIGLTSTAHTVYARLDSVNVGDWRCPIEEIRKIDYHRMKADLRLDAQAKAKVTQ